MQQGECSGCFGQMIHEMRGKCDVVYTLPGSTGRHMLGRRVPFHVMPSCRGLGGSVSKHLSEAVF